MNSPCPTDPSADKPLVRTLSIPATDGERLGGVCYEPTTAARATVLVLPGIGVPQRVFRHVGSFLARGGVRTVTVDYRGIGASRLAQRSPTATLSAWALHDAVGALRYVKQHFDEAPALLAHSFGGQALGIADELHEVRGAILVGSQLGHPRHWKGFERVVAEFMWRFGLPLASTLSDPIPKWVIGEPLPVAAVREWTRWGRSGDWFFPFIPGARERFAAWNRPTLVVGIEDDPIAPPRAVTALVEQLKGAPLERISVAPRHLGVRRVGHVGLFRPGPAQSLWPSWRRFILEPEVARTRRLPEDPWLKVAADFAA